MTSPGPTRKRVKVSSTATEKNDEQVAESKFNFENLLHVLFGKKPGNTVDLGQLQKERKKEKTKTYCRVCRVDRPSNGCPFHEPSLSYAADHDDDSFSYAIKSFPAEVQLCTSSIPGAKFGVCAKRTIPEGTWIGPYEGRRVSPEELSQNRDNSYVWEIYEDGQPSFYIDGSDESTSSWMRFIRCARHRDEQNLFAFQYLGNIFYRSFKEISKGTEMLVWYDDKYPQYLGIPTGLQEIEFVSSSDIVKNSNVDQTSTFCEAKDEPISRHKTDKDKDQANQLDSNRNPKGQHSRLHMYNELLQRTAPSLPQRLRHASHSVATRIPSAPHTLSTEPHFQFSNAVTSMTSQRIYGGSTVASSGLPVVSPHYTLPTATMVPPLQSIFEPRNATPSGSYGISYRPHAPVNISAGIPPQSMMGSIPGRSQMGITGTQFSRVQEKVLDEGLVIFSNNNMPYDDRTRFSSSSSQIDNTSSLEKDGFSQRQRNSFSSVAIDSEGHAHREIGVSRSHSVAELESHSQIYTASKRQPTEGNVDTDVSQKPSFYNRKSPSSNHLNVIEEESSLEAEKRLSSCSHAPRERSPDEQRSEKTRKFKSHRTHVNKEDNIPSTLHSKASLVTGLGPSDESQLQDEAAGESSDSNSNSSMKNEARGIDEISMWRCRQCQKTFTQRVMLQVHVCPHQPLKPYRCGQCELSFATSTELRSHVDTHSSEKPFKCGFCSRSFAGATTLNNHIRTHMGKRPFSCEQCGKTFAQAGQLSRHQRTPGECDTQTSKP